MGRTRQASDFRLFANVGFGLALGLCYVGRRRRGCRRRLFPGSYRSARVLSRRAFNRLGVCSIGRLLRRFNSHRRPCGPCGLGRGLAFRRSVSYLGGCTVGFCFSSVRRCARGKHVGHAGVVGRVRQKGHEPGLGDGSPHHALMLGARAGLLARVDPRSIGYVTPQAVNGFVVDRIDVVHAEVAYASAAPEAAPAASELSARASGSAGWAAALAARTRSARRGRRGPGTIICSGLSLGSSHGNGLSGIRDRHSVLHLGQNLAYQGRSSTPSASSCGGDADILEDLPWKLPPSSPPYD